MEERMADIGIIGSGTWGTALGLVLYGNGHSDGPGDAFRCKRAQGDALVGA